MELHTWLAFFAASWAISLSPGPGAVAAMSSGLSHGFARGYFLTLGLVLGIWTQVLVVGLGLGALIAASGIAFSVVKWLGVAYLVWLGIKQWRASATPLVATTNAADVLAKQSPTHSDACATRPSHLTRRTLVLRGWMINAVNPKGTVFLLAVVPQFLELGRALGIQYLVIGATLGFTDLVVMAGYTSLASRVLGMLKSPRHLKLMNRTFGGLFVAAGALLATFKRG
jgi:homoserine/homoserine lactone efflux protein